MERIWTHPTGQGERVLLPAIARSGQGSRGNSVSCLPRAEPFNVLCQPRSRRMRVFSQHRMDGGRGRTPPLLVCFPRADALPLLFHRDRQAGRVRIVDPHADQTEFEAGRERHFQQVAIALLVDDRIDDGRRLGVAVNRAVA